jgi:phage-related protein (TIGR01555 family)
MNAKVSVQEFSTAARAQDRRQRRRVGTALTNDAKGTPSLAAVTNDSFVNYAMKMGMGADNALSSSSYGFNPISRQRTLLEWSYRGSWIGGLAVDVVADDMTRAGIEYVTELEPDVQQRVDKCVTSLNLWHGIGDTIRWGRLYGGAICVALIDGQDMRTPLRIETVGRGQFKGVLALDRWMLDPVLDDLVTDFGPHLGLPRYYRVSANAPALRGAAVHHSRVLIRHEGITLPYNQKLMENLWGMSVIERMYDRMIGFDSATTGAAQLVHKSYLRTLSILGFRDIVASGGPALDGLVKYVDIMRRFQGIEGITVIDGEDKLEVQTSQALSGMEPLLIHFGQQLSGALQIPLVRLFGQSPAGLNSTGESDLRMYYDNISQRQQRDIYHGVTMVYRLSAQSSGVELPPDFALAFKSLWQMKDDEKQTIAKTNLDTVTGAHDSGLISPQTALRELRQTSRATGVFTNVTSKMIAEADDQIPPPPGAEGAMPPPPPEEAADGGSTPAPEGNPNANEVRPQREAAPVDQSSNGRRRIQPPAPGSSQAGGGDHQGIGSGRQSETTA